MQGLATGRMELSFFKSKEGTGRNLGVPDYQVPLVIQLEMSNRQFSAEVESSERVPAGDINLYLKLGDFREVIRD